MRIEMMVISEDVSLNARKVANILGVYANFQRFFFSDLNKKSFFFTKVTV